jgi:cysteinyl-tRNA synthetase
MRALSTLVDELLAERLRARAEKDFARADAIRDRLLASGIAVEDTPDGPLWTLKDS